MKITVLSGKEGQAPTDVLLVGDWAVADKQVVLDIRPAHAMFFNLEGPQTKSDISWDLPIKVGPRVFNESLPAFEGPKFASLSNNHMMDFGQKALKNTLHKLKEQGIYSAGIVESSLESSSYTVFSHIDRTWAVVSVSDPQFGTPTLDGPGIAAMNPSIYRLLGHLRDRADIVVVSFHGGQEELTIPSPERVKLFRSFVDAGADIVWGHHPHVAQVYEEYGDGAIFYGLGNFAVDPDKWASDPRQLWSLGVRVGIEGDRMTVAPVILSIEGKNPVTVRELDTTAASSRLAGLEGLGEILKDSVAHSEVWGRVATYLFWRNMRAALGWGGSNIVMRFRLLLVRALSSLGITNPRRYLDVYRFHLIANSAHREVIEAALKTSVEPRRERLGKLPVESLKPYIMD